MIILYSLSNLHIATLTAGTDATTLANWIAGAPVGYQAFAIADDVNVLASPSLYYVVESAPGVPTGTALKNVITITPSIDPIHIKDQPTLNIQLKQPDGITNLNESHTISLEINAGILASDSVTTDAFGAGSTTYKPSKTTKPALSATAPKFNTFGVILNVITPTSPAEQNWLESNDVKLAAIVADKVAPNAITTEKIAAGAVTLEKMGVTGRMGVLSPSNWFAQKRAFLDDTKDAGLTDSVNSIVSDGIDHIYINGLDGATPKIKKINMRTMAIDGTYAYTNHNLSNRTDGMTYDGKFLWVASAGDLLRVNPVSMTLDATIAIDATGGKIQAVGFDGEYIYAFLRGGTSAYANHIICLTRDGDIAWSLVLSANDLKQIAFSTFPEQIQNPDYVRLLYAPINVTSGDITGITILSRQKGLCQFSVFPYTGAPNGTIAFDGSSIWIGVTPSGLYKQTLLKIYWPDAISVAPVLLGSMTWTQIGHVYDLFFDGTSMWAITSEAGDPPASSTRRYIRKLQQLDIANPIQLIQTVDLGPDINPNALCVEKDRICIANFASTT